MKPFLLLVLLLGNATFAAELEKGAILELVSITQAYEQLELQSMGLVSSTFTEAERNLKIYEGVVEYERLKSEASLIKDRLLGYGNSTPAKDAHYALQLYNHFSELESALGVTLSAESWTMPFSELSIYRDRFSNNVSLFYLTLEVGFPGLWDYESE